MGKRENRAALQWFPRPLDHGGRSPRETRHNGPLYTARPACAHSGTAQPRAITHRRCGIGPRTGPRRWNAGMQDRRTARLCAAMCHKWPVPLCGEGTQCGVWVEQRAQWCMGVADGVWVSPPACAGESRGVRAAGPAEKAETGRAAARRVTRGGNGRVTAGRSAAVPVGSVWDFLGLSGLYTFRGSGWSFAVGAGWLGYSGGFSALV